MPRPLVFVLGAPRSGTTLLRVMLAGHPELFSPPEMVLAPFVTMAERKAKLTERFWEKGGLRRAIMELDGVDVDTAKATESSLETLTVPEVYAWLQTRIGDKMLVDKCPHLAADPAAMQRLASWYPDAKWVWIVRHPGSVTRSVENMPMAEVMLQGYAGDARDIWLACNRNIQRFLLTVPADQQVRVTYEELVTDAKPALQRISTCLGVPFHDAMLDPYEGERMREGPPGARAIGDPNLAGRGKIEPELATKWLEGFDPASVGPDTHALARELGYNLGSLAAPPITRVTSAMNELFASVSGIEAKMRVPADLDAAEGRRFLLRQLGHSLDLFVEHNDAEHPRFEHAEGPTRKSFADCPDADYLRAPIRTDAKQVYKVTGQVPPGTTYVGILLYRRGGQVGNRLSDTAFVKEDGSFEVVISTEQPESGTWLRAHGDDTAVMVRQYFTDRTKQSPVVLSIQRLPGLPATELDADSLAKGLERARRNLEATMQRTEAAYKMASHNALNRFIPIGGEQLFPTPDNSYLVCWYRFGADQLMRVGGVLPKGRYVGFTLYNVWMESLDYHQHRVVINHDQLVMDENRRFELVLSNTGVDHPNRLDTAGHLAGYLLLRVLLPEGPIEPPVIDVLYEREWRS